MSDLSAVDVFIASYKPWLHSVCSFEPIVDAWDRDQCKHALSAIRARVLWGHYAVALRLYVQARLSTFPVSADPLVDRCN